MDHMQTIHTLLQTDNYINTSMLNFYRSDALPDALPTVSKHWRLSDNYHNTLSSKHTWLESRQTWHTAEFIILEEMQCSSNTAVMFLDIIFLMIKLTLSCWHTGLLWLFSFVGFFLLFFLLTNKNHTICKTKPSAQSLSNHATRRDYIYIDSTAW